MSSPITDHRRADMITGRELAARVDEPYSTIDYWSKMGLLAFLRRGNKRLYDAPSSEARCERIRERQNAGLNLTAIKEELEREQPVSDDDGSAR